MIKTQRIYCPNCGARAEKHFCSDTNIVRTSCYSCDYLLVQCSKTAKVIEAYAPGINFIQSRKQNEKPLVAHRQR